MVANMRAMFGDVTDLQQRHHPYNIPHLVEKIKGFPLKAKSFRNMATYQNPRGDPSTPLSPPCTTVGVWLCVYVRGLNWFNTDLYWPTGELITVFTSSNRLLSRLTSSWSSMLGRPSRRTSSSSFPRIMSLVGNLPDTSSLFLFFNVLICEKIKAKQNFK